MRYLLADPNLTHRGPGEEFARAVAADRGGPVTVRLAVSLPTTFPLAAHRPRYTVRHLLKTATVVDETVRFVAEPPAPDGPQSSGDRYGATPEARFHPQLAQTKLTELAAGVPLPAGLTDDPALLAAFVDHRVVVRLCTVENEVFLHGSADGAITGLLHLPGLRRRAAPGPLGAEVVRAAARVEEMGGSCDGIVVHPDRYWELVHDGLLGRLAEAGVRVSRTRMIAPDLMLFGDFRAAVTLVEPGVSTLSLRPGAGPDGADLVTAALPVGLAVHLPQHFLLLERQ
ncbi:family 3 encapsulin nanocompartment shell protein [Polymorphospora sp. NPDC050346]|uniref:family 3 encapsulin nanocompartment shell protein n=1 Tax=Polymorphospora sp. NPDC050346 TaxID=3155780 RepID=UPI0033EE2261